MGENWGQIPLKEANFGPKFNPLVVILRLVSCSFYMLVLIHMLFFDFLYLPGVFYQFIFKIQAKKIDFRDFL